MHICRNILLLACGMWISSACNVRADPPAVGSFHYTISEGNLQCKWELKSVTPHAGSSWTYDVKDGSLKIGTVTVSISTTSPFAVSYSGTVDNPSGYNYTFEEVTGDCANASDSIMQDFPTDAVLGDYHSPTRYLGAFGIVTVEWIEHDPIWDDTGTSTVEFGDYMDWRNEVWQVVEVVDLDQ